MVLYSRCAGTWLQDQEDLLMLASDTGLDCFKLPNGEDSWSKFVCDVSHEGDIAERDYLELKGSMFDITSKRDKQKIAKFILGSANRNPEIAKRHFQGSALMVLGVGFNSILGVKRIEKVELDRVINPFLGASGPRWDIQRVPIKGNQDKEVLIIIVDPPYDGQPPFPCRADGEGLKNGALYIRADGETREVKADELDMLINRARRRLKRVKLRISVKGSANQVTIDRSRTLDEYIENTTKTLLEAAKLPDRFSSISPILNNSIFYENRTRDEYSREIKQWQDDCVDKWDDACRRIGAAYCDPIDFIVDNTTKVNLKAVKIKIHSDYCLSLIDQFDSDEVDLGLPEPPSRWRSGIQPLLYTFDPTVFVNHKSKINVVKVNSGIDIIIDVGDLRPLDTINTKMLDEEPQVLLVPAEIKRESINCNWTATADGIDDVFTGKLTIPVGPVKDLTKVTQILLRV